MKKLILTSAIILSSVATLFAQENKTAGSPIGGIVVKGGFTSGQADVSGSPIGGIVVKGGFTSEQDINNPLYNAPANASENPLCGKTDHFFCIQPTGDMNSNDGNPIGGIIVKRMNSVSADGQPIGGIVVKGGQNGLAVVSDSPLYQASGLEVTSALYAGGGH